MDLPNMKDAKIRSKKEVLTTRFKLDDKYNDLGLNKTYYLKTYGCQMNEHDSENIKALLEQVGFKEVSTIESADVVILNTCAVRENVHNKVYGMLGRLKHLKETKKDLIVCLGGCMPQEEVVALTVKDKYKWIDIVFGTHNFHLLPEMIDQVQTKKEKYFQVLSIEGDIIEDLPAIRDNKYKAWVNIMYGCDKFCTYCIVPYTRGKERSRSQVDIVNEVKDIKEKGYLEVTLLGQNVNAYGKDLPNGDNFANLLQVVSETKIPRIRFLTSHPWDFTDELIEVIQNNKNVMPYVHLPIQSGSDDILKKMGRKYTKEEYLTLFNKIKKQIKDVAITTDIIVGFPNETKEDFNQTLEVVNTCQFDLAFTFIYSKKEGTPAALIKDKITLQEKKERLYQINELINHYANLNNQKYLNKVIKVLIEGKNDKGYLFGYSETMKLVNVTGDDKCIGKIVDVKITKIKTFCLYGKI